MGIFITLLATVFAWMVSVAEPLALQPPERFDMIVRSDFFAGFAGDSPRLERAMAFCERMLARDPDHAEALVWHGAGLGFRAGEAFSKGDMATGSEFWTRGLEEMNRAVALAPDSIGVRVPRGGLLLQATRTMPPAMARPLVELALTDYERALEVHGTTFHSLGDHPKGELLFGLAEGYSRLGRLDKARLYFERLIADAPGSGQTPKATAWLATGSIPASQGLTCVGCHK